MTPDGIPRLVRLRDTGIVGGVCAGIADHLRVSVVWVRVTFAMLAVMGGAGVLAYALLWMFVPQGSRPRRVRPPPSNAGRPTASPRSAWRC